MVVELDLQRAVLEEFGRPGTSDLVEVIVTFPVEGSVGVSVGDLKACLEGAEGDLAVPVGADVQLGRPAEVELAVIPEVGRDDPPATDHHAIQRRAHGEASAGSFGSRTRL